MGREVRKLRLRVPMYLCGQIDIFVSWTSDKPIDKEIRIWRSDTPVVAETLPPKHDRIPACIVEELATKKGNNYEALKQMLLNGV